MAETKRSHEDVSARQPKAFLFVSVSHFKENNVGPGNARRRGTAKRAEGPKLFQNIMTALLGVALCFSSLITSSLCVTSTGLKISALSPPIHSAPLTNSMLTGHRDVGSGAFPVSAGLGLPLSPVNGSVGNRRPRPLPSKSPEKLQSDRAKPLFGQFESHQEVRGSASSEESDQLRNKTAAQSRTVQVFDNILSEAASVADLPNLPQGAAGEGGGFSIPLHHQAPPTEKRDEKQDLKRPRKAPVVAQVVLEPSGETSMTKTPAGQQTQSSNNDSSSTKTEDPSSGEPRRTSFAVGIAILVALLGVLIVLLSVPWLTHLARYGMGRMPGRSNDSRRRRKKRSDVDEYDPTIANLADVEDGFEKIS